MIMQPGLEAFFGGLAPCDAPDGGPWAFVDLFCGIGGASQGASDAGHEVVLAVDSCPEALGVHARNHPRAQHLCVELPPAAPLPLPTSGRWHLHGSPPCTRLTQLNKTERDSPETLDGIAMVRWYVEFALASAASTWTMEQVDMPEVRAVLEERMARGSSHRGRLDYQVVDVADLGAPQRRKRLIAGTPALIARLRRLERARRSVRDAVPHPRGTHVRPPSVVKSRRVHKDAFGRVVGWGYHRHTGYEIARPVDEPGYTITGGGGRWVSPAEGDRMLSMTVAEAALIQTFPTHYTMHPSRKVAMKGVGNAVPPLLMRRLLGGPLDAPPPPPPPPVADETAPPPSSPSLFF